MSSENLTRSMWQIALPSIIANLSIPLLGLVDSFMMGHLSGSQYLGAVALGAMVFSLLYNGLNFLRMGTTGLTAQAAGRHDSAEISRLFLRSLASAVFIGFLIMLAQFPLGKIIFLITDASHQVESLAQEYFFIRIWSAPFALINFVAVGWLLGLHRAKAALLIQLYMNVSNIGLNMLFVYGLDMKVDGVAYGTLCAEISASLLAVYIISRHHHVRADWRDVFQRAAFTRLFRLNRDIFIRTICLTLSMAAFTILGAGFGDNILAANAILMNVHMMTSFGLDGFAQAAEVLVGKEVGRKSRIDLRRAVILTSKWALFTALVFFLIYLIFGSLLIDLLTNLPDVRRIARSYLVWLIILPLISVWSFQFDGIFIGATKGRHMRNGMVISMAVFALSLLVFLPLWGNHGLWLSYSLFMITRGVTLALKYPELEKSI